MGKRGPVPTPTAVLRLRGSWRANRPGEPQPPGGRPRRPRELSGAAAKVWPRLLDCLERVGTLAATDGFALARYCELSVRWWRAERFLIDNGETYGLRGKDGKVRYIAQRPEVSIVSNLSRELRALEAEFGLTPAARTRVQVSDDVPDDDSLLALMRKRDEHFREERAEDSQRQQERYAGGVPKRDRHAV